MSHIEPQKQFHIYEMLNKSWGEYEFETAFLHLGELLLSIETSLVVEND
jgi:hypothetical protein